MIQSEWRISLFAEYLFIFFCFSHANNHRHLYSVEHYCWTEIWKFKMPLILFVFSCESHRLWSRYPERRRTNRTTRADAKHREHRRSEEGHTVDCVGGRLPAGLRSSSLLDRRNTETIPRTSRRTRERSPRIWWNVHDERSSWRCNTSGRELSCPAARREDGWGTIPVENWRRKWRMRCSRYYQPREWSFDSDTVVERENPLHRPVCRDGSTKRTTAVISLSRMSIEFKALSSSRTQVLNIRTNRRVTSVTHMNIVRHFHATHVIDFTGEGKTENDMGDAIRNPEPLLVEVLQTRRRDQSKSEARRWPTTPTTLIRIIKARNANAPDERGLMSGCLAW